jgi:hypothetical protein
MATQIINDPYANTVTSLGSAVGRGLGSGLQELADQKMLQMRQRNQYDLAKKSNLTEEDARLFAQFTPGSKESLSFLNNLWQRGGQVEQQPKSNDILSQIALQPEFQNRPGVPGIPIPPFTKEGQPTNQLSNTPINQQDGNQEQPGTKPTSSFYKPPLKEQREREVLDLKRKKFELDRQQQDINNEEKVMPFVNKEYERAENANESKTIATEMRDILVKNRDKWPEYSGYLPTAFQRDPDVREYIRQSSNLITAQSNMLKGLPSKYRVGFIEQGKINLTQPYETQLAALDSVIKNADKILEIPKKIERAREENNGRYPRDIASKIYGKEGRVSDNNEPKLGATSNYPDGTRADEPGQPSLIVSNGKWITYKV